MEPFPASCYTTTMQDDSIASWRFQGRTATHKSGLMISLAPYPAGTRGKRVTVQTRDHMRWQVMVEKNPQKLAGLALRSAMEAGGCEWALKR